MELLKPEKILKQSVYVEMLEDVNKYSDEMIKFCKNIDGVALAAPQIGIFKKFFVTVSILYPNTVFINPYYEKTTKSKIISSSESCLSYGKDNIYTVNRYETIFAEWYDVKGEYFVEILSGIKSIIFQHETDHLSGITVVTKGVKI